MDDAQAMDSARETFMCIYPSQRQNLLPTLEIITHNFQKIQNFGKNSKI